MKDNLIQSITEKRCPDKGKKAKKPVRASFASRTFLGQQLVILPVRITGTSIKKLVKSVNDFPEFLLGVASKSSPGFCARPRRGSSWRGQDSGPPRLRMTPERVTVKP